MDEKIQQTETGYRLSIKSKRGTGTRDEDTISATIKTETLDELEEVRSDVRSAVLEEMGVFRGFQPDDGGEE